MVAQLTADSLQQANNQSTSGLSASSMLEQIFGPIAQDPMSFLNNPGGGGDVLGTVFMYINMGLLVFAGIYIGYKSLAGITNTAHDGEFMGKSFHNTWVPVRLTVGIFSLLPVAGGWSAFQIIMLWFGVMGAGLGNMAWQAAVGANFLPFKTVTLSPGTGSGSIAGSFDKSFIPQLFLMHTCVYAHNAALVAGGTTLGSTPMAYGAQDVPTQYIEGNGAGTTVNGYRQFGSYGGKNSECGQVAYATASSGMGSGYAGAGSSFWGSTDVSAAGITTAAQRAAIESAAQVQFNSIDLQVDALARKFVLGPSGNDGVAGLMSNPDQVAALTPYDPVAVNQMAQNYQNSLTVAIAGTMQQTNALTDAAKAMQQHAQEDGFVTAGAWYMTMAQTSYQMNSVAQNVSPSVGKTVDPPSPSGGASIWLTAYDMVQYGNKSASGDAAFPTSSGGSNAAWKLIWKNMSNAGGCLVPGQKMVDCLITESSGEPVMIRLKNMADHMVDLGMIVMIATGGAIGVLNDTAANAIADIGLAVVSGGLGNIAKAAGLGSLNVVLDLVKFVAQISIGFFMMASIYLPMVPFVIFMGQVLNWLITVIEGVAAAPFLSFAHLETEGEGLGQKTQYGYTFMLQSFMRPVMLVLGFMTACLLLETIGGYILQIYPVVVANVQMDSVTGFLSIIGFTAVFFVIMTGIVNSCMTVMYLIPDAIFAFIGSHSSAMAQVGRDEAHKLLNETAAGTAISRQGQSHIDRQGAAGRRKGNNDNAPPGSENEDGFRQPR